MNFQIFTLKLVYKEKSESFCFIFVFDFSNTVLYLYLKNIRYKIDQVGMNKYVLKLRSIPFNKSNLNLL